MLPSLSGLTWQDFTILAEAVGLLANEPRLACVEDRCADFHVSLMKTSDKAIWSTTGRIGFMQAQLLPLHGEIDPFNS